MAITQYLTRWGFLPFLLLLFLAIQIPFLEADPHVNIAPTSRDAFTDEGLNTSQVINRVNHGQWKIDECDNLIKTPLFSLWLYPAYSLFGTSTFTGRCWVLCGCLLLLYFASRKHAYLPWILGVFILLSFTQFHLFQYLRFTMAEMTACCLVLVALAFSIQHVKANNIWDLVWSGLFLWAAVFVKNQFAYTLALLPLWLFCIQLLQKNLFSKRSLVLLACSIGVLLAGGLLYYFIWYLPTQATYDYVMADQAGGRFIPFSQFADMQSQAEEYLFGPYTAWYVYFTLGSTLLCIVNFIISRDRILRTLSLLTFVWALIEIHKFAMLFVPARYLSALLFAWGLFAAVQLVWAIKNALDYRAVSKIMATISVIFFLALIIQQAALLKKTYNERQFVMRDTNRMLQSIPFGNRPVIGPWAPALARETGARVIPVWYNYFNDKNILENLHPKVVITEADEGDSGGAYKNNGIDLQAIADSSKQVKIARFDLMVYFLP